MWCHNNIFKNQKGKEEEGSNESSSEENEEENEEEEESSTKAAEEVITTVKVTPVVYSTTEAYIKPAYVIRPTAATYSPSKVNYIQVPGPVYKPVVVTTTEAPYTPLVVVSVVKPSVPAVKPKPIDEPSKYVKPASILTAALETTTKYAPIVFEKPSSAPVVTVRKSGWVRAPGYNLGYARSESSGPAVVETPKTSAVSSGSQPATKKVVTRQSQWFFKPKSAAISISN